MSADQILKTVETMSYRERIRHMIMLGRDMQAHSVDIAELRRGGVYERMLAIYTCYTSRDADHVMAALNDESRMIRRQALKLLALTGNDAQVIGVLETVPRRAKLSLANALTKQRPSRQSVIDLYIRQCVERHQEDEARLLLSYGSASVIRQFIEPLISASHPIEWTQLARRHPALTLAELHKRAQTARQTDHWIVWAAHSAVPFLIQARIEGLVPFVETLLRHFQPNTLTGILQRAVSAYPQQMAAIALASPAALPIHFQQVVEHLNDLSVVTALVEKNYLNAPAVWLKNVSPAQRIRLYDQFGTGWRDKEGILSTAIIATLSSEQRAAEARRHLKLPVLQTRTPQRIAYAALLPLAEAQTVLESFIRNPDPQLRIVAIETLIETIRYDRSHAADLLAFLRARKNEQDPIRLAIFTALANLPPSLWHSEHLEGLDQLIRDALNAADLSRETRRQIDALVLNLIHFHQQWAIHWLTVLIQERNEVAFHHLEFQNAISEAAMLSLGPALLPVLHLWEVREHESALMGLFESMGNRIRLMPEFADVLEKVVKESVTDGYGYSLLALRTLREHFKDRAALLIPRLIAEDPSWATQEVVYDFLHRYRQDLITPFLGQNVYTGRFSTGKTRFVLPLDRGFERWTPTQQAIFAQILSDVGSDLERDMPSIIRSVRQLTGLIYIAPERLLALIEDERLPVRDTALRALGRLDGNQGVAALLSVMGDDRGRIAIYALRQAMLQMSPDQTLALLESIPLTRVSVAKEVVRLIGEINSEAAYQKLLDFSRQDLHRDVHVALLRAFWTHLDRDETWAILTAAADSNDPAVAKMAGRTMAPGRSAQVERQLIGLLIRVMQHSDPQVRVDVLNRIATQAVHDADHALAQPLLERLRSPLYDEVRATATAFSTYARQDTALAGQIVEQMLNQRRTLHILASALIARLWAGNAETVAMGRGILAALEKDPMTVMLRLDVGVRIFSITEFGTFLQRLASAGELYADALMQAVQGLANHHGVGTAQAAALEQKWRKNQAPILRRLGLAILIGSTKQPFGWTAGQRAILEQYRQDHDPLVASVAQFTFPPDEPSADLLV